MAAIDLSNTVVVRGSAGLARILLSLSKTIPQLQLHGEQSRGRCGAAYRSRLPATDSSRTSRRQDALRRDVPARGLGERHSSTKYVAGVMLAVRPESPRRRGCVCCRQVSARPSTWCRSRTCCILKRPTNTSRSSRRPGSTSSACRCGGSEGRACACCIPQLCVEPEQDDVPVTDEQRNELDRRLKAYALDGNRGRLASEIVAEIRRRRGAL